MNPNTLNTLEVLGTLIAEAVAYEALRSAQVNQHRGTMVSSAQLAARDAASCYNGGEFGYCYDRARESLAYSVGCFAPEALPKRR